MLPMIGLTELLMLGLASLAYEILLIGAVVVALIIINRKRINL